MGYLLEWVGARARWVLAVGVIAAFFMPEISAALRPFLTPLVAFVFCIAMARIDLPDMARRLTRPVHLMRLTLWSLGLMAVTPAIYWLIGHGVGLPESYVAALVYSGVTPPITSAAALCLIIGLNAVFALELTMMASLLTPLIGPVVVLLLLGDTVPVDAVSLGLRVGGMIIGGAVAAYALQRLMGRARIQRNAGAFDGMAAIAMWLVVVAVLDGAGSRILGAPEEAACLLLLALAFNFGGQAVWALVFQATTPDKAGAASLMWGNRTVAIYLAALPFDPVFALYVAFSQIPMLFTPLVMGAYLARVERTPRPEG
ncbi:MAG: hypothetical protein AAGE80_10330 [Pseudomonadota bacterium]